MSITKIMARKVKHAVLCGDEQISPFLDATTTTYVFELTGPASKVTMQSSDDLAYTYEVSANGKNFATPVAATANTLTSYSTNNIAVIRIIRTSGSGYITVLAT